MHSNTLRSVYSDIPSSEKLLHLVKHENKYQTPDWACELMVSMIPKNAKTVLEPTPGLRNLVRHIEAAGYTVTAPERFEELDHLRHYDVTVMNPPFRKSIENAFLKVAMEMSDTIIGLMPWFTVINCDSRARELFEFGLKSVTHLQRNTFQKIRVQPCIIHLERGYRGPTELKFVKRPSGRQNA